MARSDVILKGSSHGRTKVKTGCATCRIRKIKCDEGKPFCLRCVNTGRTCDGYQSPFRFCTTHPVKKVPVSSIKSDIRLQATEPSSTAISSEEIELLSRHFSTKTIFNVKLGCDEEAKQVLQASRTDPAIRYAVSALRALREDFELSADSSGSISNQTANYGYGLEQYSMALEGLVSHLSTPDSQSLKSILLCCQIFISIEQVQSNFPAMAQHIVRGLRIMNQYRARPGLTAERSLVPAHQDQLPLLDVYIVKLFAAPCKFAEPPTSSDVSETTSSASTNSPLQRVDSCPLRTLAPNMQSELVKIAASTLEFLDHVSQVESVENALDLLSGKSALLKSLDSWFMEFEHDQRMTTAHGAETISTSFTRMFHSILRIVLMGALDSSPELDTDLRIENDRVRSIADGIGERLGSLRSMREHST